MSLKIKYNSFASNSFINDSLLIMESVQEKCLFDIKSSKLNGFSLIVLPSSFFKMYLLSPLFEINTFWFIILESRMVKFEMLKEEAL